jgi:hypothetical protein
MLIIPSSWGSQLDSEITSTPCRIRLPRTWMHTLFLAFNKLEPLWWRLWSCELDKVWVGS